MSIKSLEAHIYYRYLYILGCCFCMATPMNSMENFRPEETSSKALVLCKLSSFEEFRVGFAPNRGAKKKHSRSYATDEQRRVGAKAAGITNSYLVYKALACLITIDSLIPVSCFGGNDGKLCFSVSGGATEYNIAVALGDTTILFPDIADSTMLCIDNLASDSYIITIGGDEGCTSFGQIEQPGFVSKS